MSGRIAPFRGRRLAGLAIVVAALVLPSAASAAETHLFNGTLSLTGNCSTSATDPVPDPGCPGGTHPPSAFARPGGVAVDQHGFRYVASYGSNLEGTQGRIDVFDPAGNFITEVADAAGPIDVAVDSLGNLYVANQHGYFEDTDKLVRFKPLTYEPSAGNIEYDPTPVQILNYFNSSIPTPNWASVSLGVAVNPANDHLFIGNEHWIYEYSSATEGNTGIAETRPAAGNAQNYFVAVDAVHDRLYTTGGEEITGGNFRTVLRIFELEAPYKPLGIIDGSQTPAGGFISEPRNLSLAVEEATGHIFIGDLNAPNKKVYEFEEDGTLVSEIQHEFAALGGPAAGIEVDNAEQSPTRGFLYVESGSTVPGHSFAFEPKPVPKVPVVEGLGVSGITEDEAIFHGEVNPEALETSYRFEYTTEQSYEEREFAGATIAGTGTLPAGTEPVAVSANVAGLSPGTRYRFRVVAHSAEGEAEAEGTFATFSSLPVAGSCPNEALRTGLSARLPDCRAYELVTPANTNGHPPFGLNGLGPYFQMRQGAPDGNRISFRTEGGPIPGFEGVGGAISNGDPYRVSRGPNGWVTEATGPNGVEAWDANPGGTSRDQMYSFWLASGTRGTRILEGKPTTYVRYPDGHSEPLGQGSIGLDPQADGLYISPGGTHIIFSSYRRQIEPDGPPAGTKGIYDRTPDGVTHILSLLPNDVPQEPAKDAAYTGSSADGSTVAFVIGKTLYVRRNDVKTYEIGTGVELSGIDSTGGRVFYVKDGDLMAFDIPDEAVTKFTDSGDATVVNVSTDGTTAYFLSPSILPVDANSYGALPQPGAQNLYASREGELRFVGTVTDQDAEGNEVAGIYRFGGLGLWTYSFDPVVLAGEGPLDTSRTTPDGNVLVFEARAPLTGYDADGHPQVFRYDLRSGALQCVSCSPTGLPPTGYARLQTYNLYEQGQALTYKNLVTNVTADGNRVFFESTEQLVVSDTDGLRDVYEWEQNGVGSCDTPGGCVYLISSGASGRNNQLFAVSESGDDVFFITSDLLTPAFDADETPSIYDARVGGGFAPPAPPAGECLGESCQPAAVAPNDPTPASAAFNGRGNVREALCPKGKKRTHAGKRSRCKSVRKVRKHHKIKHGHRRAHR